VQPRVQAPSLELLAYLLVFIFFFILFVKSL
jgi:hypothetical protein